MATMQDRKDVLALAMGVDDLDAFIAGFRADYWLPFWEAVPEDQRVPEFLGKEHGTDWNVSFLFVALQAAGVMFPFASAMEYDSNTYAAELERERQAELEAILGVLEIADSLEVRPAPRHPGHFDVVAGFGKQEAEYRVNLWENVAFIQPILRKRSAGH